MDDAKEIAASLFPEDWKGTGDFKVDQNAGRRDCAEVIAEHFIKVLRSEKTAKSVMMAFFRREHHREPTEDEVTHLRCHMGTALLAAEFQLKRQPAEGCVHELGLRLCEDCAADVYSTDSE